MDDVEKKLGPNEDGENLYQRPLYSEVIDRIILNNDVKQVSFEEMTYVRNLITEINKIDIKDAYGALVESLNKRYLELLIGSLELKSKKAKIIKSKIISYSEHSLGLDNKDINEYGITEKDMKKIVIAGLLFWAAAISTSVGLSEKISWLASLGIVTLIALFYSLIKPLGAGFISEISLIDNTLEQYLQTLVYKYKSGMLEEYDFKIKLQNVVFYLSERYNRVEVVKKGDEDAKRR